MKRKDEIPAGNALAQIPNGALDLIGPGHENETYLLRSSSNSLRRLCSKFPRGLVPRLMAEIFDLNGEDATRRGKRLTWCEVVFKLRCVHRG